MHLFKCAYGVYEKLLFNFIFYRLVDKSDDRWIRKKVQKKRAHVIKKKKQDVRLNARSIEEKCTYRERLLKRFCGN